MFIVLCVFLAVVVAMLAVATILRRKKTVSKPCSSCRGWGYWYSHAIFGPKTKETCTTCNGHGEVVVGIEGDPSDPDEIVEACPTCDGAGVLKRRLALFKSVIANVGSMMKHTAYFLMFLLSSIIGIFFMYLGSTGSWDPTTIIFSMMGVMGMIGVWWYTKVYIHPWCKRAKQEAKDNNLICTDPGGFEAEIKKLEDAYWLAGSEQEAEAIEAKIVRLEKLRDNATDLFVDRRK